jgi:hypothetical protein
MSITKKSGEENHDKEDQEYSLARKNIKITKNKLTFLYQWL